MHTFIPAARILFFYLIFTSNLYAQSWNFVKERDGIRIYTRKEKNSSLKSFMGVVDIKTTPEKVYTLIGNVKNTSWWDENLREIRVLTYEEDKHIQYYLVYHAPWPVTDRDLCVDARITTDPSTGQRIIYSVPLPDVIPESPDLVRIKKYWQRWTVQPRDNGMVHIILEGFVDPGGSVPSWLYNMVITETPLKIIRGIQSRLTPAIGEQK
jgi:hypothetical protein